MRVLAVVGLLAVPAMLTAQRAPSEAFEVASVKPQTRVAGGASWTGPRYYEPGTTLRRVIEFAYDLPPVRVEGGPKWIASDFWEIDARAASPRTVDQMRVLVKALLIERFKLMARVESRELPVYDLRVARSDGRLGPNLTPPDTCTPVGARSIESLREAGEVACGPSGLIGVGLDGSISHALRGVTLSTFTSYLERYSDRVIRDRTDISGTFDIRLRYFSPSVTSVTPARRLVDIPAPLPVALEQQLGLRLESTTGLVDVLVIESVVRPSPN